MDPNAGLSEREIRLGSGKPVKVTSNRLLFPPQVLSVKENKDEKLILRDLYQDKEFLRSSQFLFRYLFQVTFYQA